MRDSPCAGRAGRAPPEGGVLPGRVDSGAVTDEPDHETGDPELQAKSDRGGQRAVDDRDRARRAAEQDRLGQRAVQRHLEAFENSCD